MNNAFTMRTMPLLLAAALGLTACGGGSSDHTTAEKPKPEQPKQPEKPKQPEQPAKPGIPQAIQSFNQQHFAAGTQWPSSISRKETGLATYKANPNNKIAAFNQVSINGMAYNIASPDSNAEQYNFVAENASRAVSSGSFLSYSRFAVLNIEGFASDAFLAFGQNTLDKDMPHGDATYKGHGLHQAETRGTLIPTDVNATISFSAKTARIDISGDNLAFNLAGKISGNKVSGDDGLQAAFYGPEAKELAGSYAKSGNGVFGAVMHTTTE